MDLRHQRRQRGEAEIKQLMAALAAILAIYLFIITWPASLALVLTLLVWFFTGDSQSPIKRSIHDASLPVLIGIGVFWMVSVVVALARRLSDSAVAWLSSAEQQLMRARLEVHALSGPNLTVYLLFLAMLLVLLFFFPKSRLISQAIQTKKQLGRLHLCLLAMTSFTFFGGHTADQLANKEHESRLQKFEISLRTELEPAKKYLAEDLASDSVSEMIKSPTAESNRTRLRYLIESFQNPVYVDVPYSSHYRNKISEKSKLDWPLKHWSSDDSSTRGVETVRIDGSQVMRTVIADFLKEAAKDSETSQASTSYDSDIHKLAGQEFGQVAESPEEWQRQEELIQQEDARASQAQEFYKQASAGITEALSSTFSEALGLLTPATQELGKGWLQEVMDATIVPYFEGSVDRRTESVLKWSHENLAASSIQNAPLELKREIPFAPLELSKFLFPGFLRGRESQSPSSGHEEIPEEVVREIQRREEIARSEIQHRQSEARSRKDPFENLKRNSRIRPEEIRERERRREEIRERPHIK